MVPQKARPRPIKTQTHRLILDGVQAWREKTTFLKGINWQVFQGEHWAILGPNGSGKTSLIMAVSGYLPVSRGRVFLLDGWLGKIPLPEQRKRIGIVSQSLCDHIARIVPKMTAVDVVLSGLFGSLRLIDAVSDDEKQRALDILDEFDCASLARNPFHTLSTGERQACMLARSKMARTELVLLDEPCAGLDLGARERFLASLEAMINRVDSPTTVLITHHPEEIVSSISHVLLIRAGEVVAAGPKSAVMAPALLSQTFDCPLRVTADNGRYWVQAANL
jgi:iron complex transport system ATP-binding protein